MINDFIFKKKINFKFKNKFENKIYYNKSSIALDSLIGIVLSVIVLFGIINLFYGSFLQTPENLKTAKQNVQSIINFVDFGNKKYKELELTQDCGFMLKLSNIESSQLSSDENKYFYTIIKDKIYILPYKYLDKVISSKEDLSILNKYNIKSFSFNDNLLNLKKDITYKSILSIDFEFFWHFGGADNKINFLKENSKEILLIPTFNNYNNLNGKVLIKDIETIKKLENNNYKQANQYIEPYNQNNKVKSINYNNIYKFEEEDGGYLIYYPREHNLFLSHSDLTNALVRNSLCYRYEINKNNIIDNNNNLIKKQNYDKLDEINNKIIMNCLVDGKKLEGTFEWNSGPICDDKSNSGFCSDFNFKDGDKYNLNTIKYPDFLKKLENNCKTKVTGGNSIKFYLSTKIKTDKDKSVKENNIDINRILKKVSLDKSFNEIKDSQNLIKLDELNSNCDNTDLNCNYVYIIGNEISFFYNYNNEFLKDKDLTDFLYIFNTNYLRKTSDNKIYFNEKEVKFLTKKVFYLNTKWYCPNSWCADEINYYKFQIDLNGLKTIYLTKAQVKNIPLQI